MKIRPFKDLMAMGIDGVSFGMINAIQWRGRAGTHTLDELEAYFSRWPARAPEDLFAVPRTARLPDLGEGNGTRRFASPIPSDCEENNHTHMDIWLGPKGWASPMMFLLHGHMSVSDVGYRMWAQKLNRLGWSAAFFHLPYHYGRRPRGVLSGELALSSNIIRVCEGIRQAVIELRLVIRALEWRGVPHIGLWGTSYGGWVAGLLCVLERDIRTAWLLEPVADVEHVLFESPATLAIRWSLIRRGITREAVRRYFRAVCPSYHLPAVAPERILLLAGTFDRVAPPLCIRRLHQRWKGSHYAEFRQGHVGYQLMPESLKMGRRLMPGLFAEDETGDEPCVQPADPSVCLPRV
jgi:pimeloyl-ACP methyl ester carboxylesterase